MRATLPPRPATRFSFSSFLVASALALCCDAAMAQNIGINTDGSSPATSAMLDIKATDRGLLLPRVALTASNVSAPVAAPADALLIYNTATAGVAPNNVTPGFYAWNTTTSTWQPMLTGTKGWSTTGNAGTAPATNFLGTTDAQDLVFKTGGSATTNERMRMLSSGATIINSTTALAGDVFSVYGTGLTASISGLGTSAINGYSSGNGTGVFGETVSATTSIGVGAVGVLSAATTPAGATNNSIGVLGLNTSNPAGSAANASLAAGVWGEADGSAGNALAVGVRGIAFSVAGSGNGVFGTSISTLGTGVVGVATSTSVAAAAAPWGVFGEALTWRGFGVIGGNTHASGTGVMGVGNNMIGTVFAYPTVGAGVAGTGQTLGVYGIAASNAAVANGATPTRAGGYFQSGTGATLAYCYVGTYDDVARKIVGSGTMNTIVKDPAGKLVLLSAPEAPENLFQDYGTGKLVNGHAHITLDPTLAMNILVNEAHPLRAFVQLEGDCAGVYVANKTGEGFDVVELQGGTSNVSFTWTVTANRNNESHTDGVQWNYAEERFGAAPGPLETTQINSDPGRTSPSPAWTAPASSPKKP